MLRKKLYLVGKGSREKLESKEYPTNGQGLLTRETRLDAQNFQDWIWAISKVFAKDHLNFSYRFVGEDQLTEKLSVSWKPRVLSKIAPKQTTASQKPLRKLLKC